MKCFLTPKYFADKFDLFDVVVWFAEGSFRCGGIP